MKFRKIALWIGPHPDSKGGVASVVKNYENAGFFDNGRIKFIPTMKNGNKLSKLIMFLIALFLFLVNIRQTKLLHIHLSSRASFWRKSIFILIATIFRVPMIAHLHASSFPNFYLSSPSINKYFINKILSKTDKVFVLSNDIQDFLSKLPIRINSQIFPNPIILKPPKVFGPNSKQSILFLGRIVKEKGICELLEAVAIIKESFPDIQLIIGGDGDNALVHRLIDNYNIQTNVTLKGWVGEKEREILLNSSSMLVLPSYGEGQSMAILEAMESYLPVISTTVGGNTFLIENGVSGILVPPRDSKSLASAILHILQNPGIKEKMTQEARKKVEDLFDSTKVINKVMEIYYHDYNL